MLACRDCRSGQQRTQYIGARRLHTIMTTLLEDVLFDVPEVSMRGMEITRETVRAKLQDIVESENLSRYILKVEDRSRRCFLWSERLAECWRDGGLCGLYA